jgi:hypothetical protein
MNETERGQLDKGVREFFPSIQNEALTHLRITMYIDFRDEHSDIFKQIDDFYRWCHYYASNLEALDFSKDSRERINNIRDTFHEAMSIIGARIDEMKKESPL